MTKRKVHWAHADLVEKAAAWLRRKHIVVVTEMRGSGEEADAIGWDSCGQSTLIECKTSRSDFIADKKKLQRRYSKFGLGRRRIYMAPAGLIQVDELPDKWGLIEIKGFRYYTIATPTFLGDTEFSMQRELSMLISVLRREDGHSIRKYTYQTKCTASLGVAEEQADET